MALEHSETNPAGAGPAGAPAEVVIRTGMAEDAVSIARVHCDAAIAGFAHIFASTTPKPTPASLQASWQELLTHRQAQVLVAEERGDIVGVVAVAADETVRSGLTLSGLYVAPARWDSGIGAALHDQAIAHARSQGADAINLWVLEANHRARSMYQQRGWQLIPGPSKPNDEPGILDVLYELAL